VARTIALGDEEPLGEGASENNELPWLIAELTSRDVAFTQARDKIADAFLREFVTQALARHGGTVTRASAAVGVSRRYFDRSRERMGKATRATTLPPSETAPRKRRHVAGYPPLPLRRRTTPGFACGRVVQAEAR